MTKNYTLSDTREHILTTLVYFDIFNYPLLVEEIHRFHGKPSSRSEIEEGLKLLVQENIICYLDGFYSVKNDIALVAKRKRANMLAKKQMIIARKAAWVLSRFPFVRGLAISGSLSKNYGDEKADIDFFIITAPNKLWIARTILHLFKKMTYLTGRQNRYCMNYFVDESVPLIEEKNIFTAMEIITLVPMYGKNTFDDFINTNAWVSDYFPICKANSNLAPEIQKGILSTMIERIFNTGFGNWLDNWLMSITDRRWKKKVSSKRMNSKGNPMGMLVSRHCSKPNPKNFQDKVVSEFRIRIENLLAPLKEMGRTG